MSGTVDVTATVSDSSSPAQTQSIKITLVVSPTALAIGTSSLPGGTKGTTYLSSLQASGGTAPYTWSINNGMLPTGLALGKDGVISGTPTASGTSSLAVVVVDSGNPVQMKSETISIAVAPAPLTIAPSGLPNATDGASYSSSLQVGGGTSPYSWSITSGSLPSGLNLNPGTGAISGTPTGVGTAKFTATVKDSGSPAQSQSVVASLVVEPSLLAISSSSLPSGTSGVSYSGALQASGGTAPYSWSITSGSLPSGVSLNAATGTLSGTPTASGNSSIGVTVKDSGSPAQTAAANLSISVAAATVPLKITSSSLAGATTNQPYSATLSATGGTAPYSWTITSGSLPSGVSLNAATGTLSGTPTTSGNSSTGVTVKDSGSPAQTAAANLSISVAAAAVPLKITSSSLAGATTNQPYSATLSATGGTAPYSWTISSGSLPSGVSLSAATGTLSGTPTESGSFPVDVTVSDASTPAQTQTAKISLSVAVAPLTIGSSTLAAGTDGTAYSSSMAVTGGTPAYTWKVSSGSLPGGLSLAATTGLIEGTPTTAGTFKFTLSVSDNSIPVQTQSAATSLTVNAAQAPVGPGTTWYIRTDGGTRYSSRMTAGQCDGQADVAYPGTGTNQHCAFNDVRWLWQDGSYDAGPGAFPAWGWVIAGGDTVIIRGSIGSGVSWRVGWNNSSGALDSATGLYFGLQGDPYSSGIPVPPSGTASQHTRILGENYASCTSKSARTQLHGGWSVFAVLSLGGASYVDVGCLDITDYSNCGRDMDTVGCSDGAQDFARYGISLSNASTHDTLTDIRIHGMASDGIFGPTGDGFVATDLAIVGNADAGWNADDSDGTTGIGSLLITNYDISWNGCVEEYPIVDSVPYFSCRDQSTGGYGDGFGTASVNSPSPGWQVTFDNGVVSYNTQDGLDALHVGGTGSTMTITRTLAYGNEGQQFKAGGGAIATIQNNVIVGNCEAIAVATIPGRPVPTNDNLGNWCRAGNTTVLMNVIPGHPASFQDNTLFSEGSVGLEVEYATSDTGATNTLKYNNNVFVGFYNTGNQANTTPIYSNSDLKMLTNPSSSWTNNATFGGRGNWTCPAAGESNAICTDPGLADEAYHAYGYGNMTPASGSSAVVGQGVAVPAITLDYTGQTRKTPPSIGAYE